MRILRDLELEIGMHFLESAAEQAWFSKCERSRCGAVIVQNDQIISSGFNAPPGQSECRCNDKSRLSPKFKSDRSSCIHAEQHAIMDALKYNQWSLTFGLGSTLYFVRIDENGNIKFSGQPWCTICSKMALDVGISEFVLYHSTGLTAYNTFEYNELSFIYNG